MGICMRLFRRFGLSRDPGTWCTARNTSLTVQHINKRTRKKQRKGITRQNYQMFLNVSQTYSVYTGTGTESDTLQQRTSDAGIFIEMTRKYTLCDEMSISWDLKPIRQRNIDVEEPVQSPSQFVGVFKI